MEALREQRGSTPAAASHDTPTQPQAEDAQPEAMGQQHLTQCRYPSPWTRQSHGAHQPTTTWLQCMGGYLPNPMPPPLPISQHSYAHFRYIAHGGWAFCVLSRFSPATPSYQRVKRRGFARVRQQGRHIGGDRCFPWGPKERYTLFEWQQQGGLCGICFCGHTRESASRGLQPSEQATIDCNGTGQRSSQASPGLTQKTVS